MDIPFEHIADTPSAPDGFFLATSSVSHDGALLHLFVEEDAKAQISSGTEDAGEASTEITRVGVFRRRCRQDTRSGRH